jgi:outer membrane protein assembly factor BamB
LPADVALPSAREASWRFAFYNTIGERGLTNPFQITDVYGRPRTNDFFIPAAADDARVYVNLFGVQMAFDVASGKLVWSSGKLHEVNLQQAQQGVNPERYAISVRDGRLWIVSRDVEQAQQQGAFRLLVREAATGKEIFSSHRTLSSWSILGQPLVVGDVAYVGAHRHGRGRELSLLVLEARSGKLQKTISVGDYMVDQNQVAIDTCAQPAMVWHDDRLYLDTNAGALVSIDPTAALVEWAVQYESPPPTIGHHYNYVPPQSGASRPIFVGGALFSKGMRSPRLLGLSVAGPKTLWNRPVAPGATLVGADERCLYLGGEELTAYDRQTQKLLWATQLPRSARWSMPRLTQNRIYQFTSRGVCEIDKASGEILRIFRGDDLDSFGGHLFVTPQTLVTVSNEGIVAYPLEAAEKLSRN